MTLKAIFAAVILTASGLGFAVSLGAAPVPVSATAEAPAAPVLQVPAAEPLLSVRLKDGQQFEARLVSSDKYFVSLKDGQDVQRDFPWAQVAAVDSADPGVDLAALRANLKGGAAEVAAPGGSLEPRRPGTAFARALWPGILLHGSGHRYAGDNDTFLSLAGGELFGVVVGGFGASELFGAGKAGESKDTALALTVAGGAIFGLTWLYDLAFAPGAAKKFNADKGLSLEATPTGAQLAYRF